MEKYETGYKVVRKRSLVSAVIEGRDKSLQYKINEWTKPVKGFGPLCVFDTIEDAEIFNYHMLDSIYECLYEESKKDAIYYINSWKNIIKKGLEFLPRGTVLATKVKLLRRVR